jgi:predicted N-acetyltransferase YhbS
MSCSFLFRPQTPDDLPAVDALHEESFGPGRFARTAYRIREAARVPPAIALTAWDSAQLIGAIQFTAISIGGKCGAALLGPLAIASAYKNNGCGLRLMQDGLAEAEKLGFELVVLIGDLPYYQRVGFRVIPHGRIGLPGPVDPARFLAAELRAGALSQFSGMVAADNEPRPTLASAALAVPGQDDDAQE